MAKTNPPLAVGQEWKYQGKIKSFPKRVRVVQVGKKLKLEALQKSGLVEDKTVGGGVMRYHSPVGEKHSIFVITNHPGDWKFIK